MLRYIYILGGSITLGLGLLGIITPGLPTTPFIILTGILYAKGSPKLYRKLQDNKLTGMYLRRMSNGLSIKARIFTITLMWIMISVTAFVIFDEGTMRYVMLGLGVIGTISQMIFLRKRKIPTGSKPAMMERNCCTPEKM